MCLEEEQSKHLMGTTTATNNTTIKTTDRQTDRQMNRQTERQTYTQTYIKTERPPARFRTNEKKNGGGGGDFMSVNWAGCVCGAVRWVD